MVRVEKDKATNLAWWCLCAGSAALGLVGMVTMFFHHLSPDPAIFVVFARDTVEGLARYVGHFDTKGPVWNWLVIGAVWLMGVHASALAILQMVSHTVVAACLGVVVWRVAGRQSSVVAVVLWLSLVHTHAMVGVGGHPENIFVSVSCIAWVLAMRIGVRRAFAIGALAGVAAMMKSTAGLAIGLLGVSAIFSVAKQSGRERAVQILGLAGGALVSLGVVILVVWRTDDLGEMYHQLVDYSYHSAKVRTTEMPLVITKVAMLLRIQMAVPLVFACMGGWLLWCSAKSSESRRFVWVTFLWFSCEFFIWLIQGGGQVYHWIMPLPAMVIGLSGWACRDVWPIRPRLAASIPFFASIVPLTHGAYMQARMVRDRILSPVPSEVEYLATQLEPHVLPSDVIVVGFYDVSIYAELGLKMPMRMATDHLAWLDPETVKDLVERVESLPPDWIILERTTRDWRLHDPPFDLPLSIHRPNVPTRSSVTVGARAAREMLDRLGYPLFLETNAHQVYRRPGEF